MRQSSCGWLGYGRNARKMYCSFDGSRRRQEDVARRNPNRGLGMSGFCVDPRQYGQQMAGGRRLSTDEDAATAPGVETLEDEAQDVESNDQDEEERRRPGDVHDMVARRDPNRGCRGANDCPGADQYCYEGAYGNYCSGGNGIGSVCMRQSSCGWLGYG